jgi:CRISPR-associated protein Csm2
VEKIDFWKDKAKGTVDPFLFSKKAENLATAFADENRESPSQKANKRTQVRKFYDEVLRLDNLAQNKPDNWDVVLPQVHMLTAKAAYARGRGLVSDNFLAFIKHSVGQIQKPEDLAVFANFFEAFMGFYRMYLPKG